MPYCMHLTHVTSDWSNYRPFVPKTFRSQERKVPMENFRSTGTKVPGTFVPGTFRSRELSFSGNESSLELSFLGPFVPGNFRSHYPIGLVAILLCVLNYCIFGCDFTLMMLTPLWTSQLTLYVGRPAFAARLFVFVCQLASSHLFALHSYLTEKTTRTHLKLFVKLSLFLENEHY